MLKERPFSLCKALCRHFRIGRAACLRILHDKPELKKFHLRLVPHALSINQKGERISRRPCRDSDGQLKRSKLTGGSQLDSQVYYNYNDIFFIAWAKELLAADTNVNELVPSFGSFWL
jgi:hypothetical protein